jgi:hypothetical protein
MPNKDAIVLGNAGQAFNFNGTDDLRLLSLLELILRKAGIRK